MFQVLDKVSKHFPHLQIIMGIDANHCLKPQGFWKIFPNTEDMLTTCKKRTSMQPQFSKANKLVQEVKDHIVANGNLTKQKILKVNL